MKICDEDLNLAQISTHLNWYHNPLSLISKWSFSSYKNSFYTLFLLIHKDYGISEKLRQRYPNLLDDLPRHHDHQYIQHVYLP